MIKQSFQATLIRQLLLWLILYSPAEIVQILTFKLHNFFMIGYCSRGQIRKMKQLYHVGTLGHSENWVLVSKKKKGIAKRTFLKIFSKYLFTNLEPFFGYRLNLARLYVHSRQLHVQS